MIRALLRRLLAFIEYLYLRANGWRRIGRDLYSSPVRYPWRRKDPYVRGHAVNAQKCVEREARYERRAARKPTRR